VGPSVPSHVSRRWVSPHGASLSSRGSRRARFPAFSGTTKALRLPARVCPRSLWLRSKAPHASPIFVLAAALPGWRRTTVGPGVLVSRAPLSGMPHEDPRGISQVSWQSIPHLCPVPRPRPDRRDLANAVSPMLPPVPTLRRLQRVMISGLPQGFSIRCLRFTNGVADAHARLASGWWAAPLPGGS
jgi:hypothetical protein